MKYFLVGTLGLFLAGTAYAYIPLPITQASLLDITPIENPEQQQSFYGQLESFPHTYEIKATEAFLLDVQILAPDIASSKNNISAIIVREVGNTGGVEEIGRLEAEDAPWESAYEPFGGDRYRGGPTFTKEVESGTYRVEVHSADNVEKYVLKVGSDKNSDDIGYLETIRRIASVKVFFEKPQWRIIESPFVYGPLIAAVCIFSCLWLCFRQKARGVY